MVVVHSFDVGQGGGRGCYHRRRWMCDVGYGDGRWYTVVYVAVLVAIMSLDFGNCALTGQVCHVVDGRGRGDTVVVGSMR